MRRQVIVSHHHVFRNYIPSIAKIDDGTIHEVDENCIEGHEHYWLKDRVAKALLIPNTEIITEHCKYCEQIRIRHRKI